MIINKLQGLSIVRKRYGEEIGKKRESALGYRGWIISSTCGRCKLGLSNKSKGLVRPPTKSTTNRSERHQQKRVTVKPVLL